VNLELLQKICGLAAPSSGEGAVRDCVIDLLKDVADEIKVDPLGSVIARKKGAGPKVMFACHMDQPSFMINFIDKDGFLRFSHMGKLAFEQIRGQRVVFQNDPPGESLRSVMTGVIACEKIRDKQQASMIHLYMDAGFRSREEAEKHIAIGGLCVFAGETVIDGRKIISPGLGRAGAFVLAETAKAMQSSPNDMYFVFNAQREVDFAGAKASVWTVSPDYAVCFDLAPSHDIPSPEIQQLPVRAGNGAAIKIKDSSVICHPGLIHFIEDTAKENGVRVQFEISESFQSGAGPVHTANGGVPAGGVSIPARGIDSAHPIALLSDIEESLRLALHLAQKPFENLV
jgi:endoglucanase